jgi:hypothetical protein
MSAQADEFYESLHRHVVDVFGEGEYTVSVRPVNGRRLAFIAGPDHVTRISAEGETSSAAFVSINEELTRIRNERDEKEAAEYETARARREEEARQREAALRAEFEAARLARRGPVDDAARRTAAVLGK